MTPEERLDRLEKDMVKIKHEWKTHKEKMRSAMRILDTVNYIQNGGLEPKKEK